eukprot:Protomagalhaensia_wolfi_Nauph_80__6067@NODE_84_length_3866_cov_229_538542_g64_i0_p4_GENE_NODE_84_length_3866_cov_229_538542_g64_i0NODE_84_length_3866_cov_229_538542_g64_i0_p4_ORF_typecomplete_len222_score29_97DUF3488/PF11992_8/25DUF3488/PF11992_8/1_2DUF2207/PF09972_9/0_78DUF2207/PF09972_9/12YtpI/PF14007_6/0_063DUF3784/PF12650_7/0_043DUF3784/PF12650_7/7_8e03Mito_fiss_reg/PF05308_11/0_2DUF1624/PF07786_12/1_7DUF2614/PF11023_8/1_2DUF4064/PF13273_6/3_3e03DUF4064/PF13273_6/11DUF4064/PF13273_6/76DUF309
MYSKRGSKTPGGKSMICGGIVVLALGGLRFAMDFNWWWLVILVLLGIISIIFYATAKLPKACISFICLGVTAYQVYDRGAAFANFDEDRWHHKWFDDEEEIAYGILGGGIAAASLALLLYLVTLGRLFKVSQESQEEDLPVTVIQTPNSDAAAPAPANVTVAVNNYAGYPGAVLPPPPPPPPPPVHTYPPPGHPPAYDGYHHYPPHAAHDQWGHPVYPPRH